MARRGRRVIARFVGSTTQHQAIAMADRIVIVQRQHDFRVRQHAPREERQFGSAQKQVMKMYDVRLILGQQAREILDRPIAVDLAQIEAVEMARPQNDLVAGGTNSLEACSRARLAVKGVGGRDEQGFDAGSLVGLKEVAREYL